MFEDPDAFKQPGLFVGFNNYRTAQPDCCFCNNVLAIRCMNVKIKNTEHSVSFCARCILRCFDDTSHVLEGHSFIVNGHSPNWSIRHDNLDPETYLRLISLFGYKKISPVKSARK